MSLRRMPRKWGVWIVVVALAGAISAIGISPAATTVSVEDSAGLNPSRLPKNKFKPASLNVVVESNVDSPGEIPDEVRNTRLEFDDDGKITTTGLATCNRSVAQLQQMTTQQARAACRASIVGSGTARALIPPATTTNAVVSAFNGPKAGRNPTILLHAQTDIGVIQVLRGTISKINAGDFGYRLVVPVPDLPAGAVLTRFETTVKKKWRHRGRTYNYISGRCHDGNKTLNIRGTFDMATGPNQTSAASQRCTVAR
jgi:hypothetical protein